MNFKLIKFRQSLSMSQKDMALALGISVSFYIKIESGERNPSFNFIKKLKRRFNVNIDRIFFENNTHEKCSEKTVKPISSNDVAS
ncbi:helix-turn-helix transcriptional regulator [Clostridium sp. AWRP]|uniref:helix-turn-helix transcriptional regulator n=1 Tax=Clostridium sp. AWRP TaxID=2212991 RepID=UPI000FDC3D67|nr:helix-turn-helix transcriptional regulator [Clostridium sp. AWRP]AZV57939.1 helix-turn-helix transcriptional regulator [Clostridium sp. AWRP]